MEKFNSDDKRLHSKLVVLSFFPCYFRTLVCLEHSDGGSLELQSTLPDGNYQQVSGCYSADTRQHHNQTRDGWVQAGQSTRGVQEKDLFAALK